MFGDSFMQFLELCKHDDGGIFEQNKNKLSDKLELNFKGNGFRSEGIDYFKQCEYFTKVKNLYFNNYYLGPNGVKTLMNNCNFLQNLRVLSLGSNNLGPIGVKYFSESEFCSKLITLNLSSNDIGDEGMLSLSKCEFLFSLNKINLGFNNISKKGLGYMSNGCCESLQEIYLDNNKIDAEGIENLIHSNFINNIIYLNLNNNKIGPNG